MPVVLTFIFVFVLAFTDVRFVFVELQLSESSIIKVVEANIYSKIKYFYNQNPFCIIDVFHLIALTV